MKLILPNLFKILVIFSRSNFNKGDISFFFGYSIYKVGVIFPNFFLRNNSISDLSLSFSSFGSDSLLFLENDELQFSILDSG